MPASPSESTVIAGPTARQVYSVRYERFTLNQTVRSRRSRSAAQMTDDRRQTTDVQEGDDDSRS